MDPEHERLLSLDPDKALEGWQRPVYMVHEHHSQRHHWDLRLEFDGVLRSWAVPKGLPTEPGVKRLAVAVPDHALSYAPFEGVIPEGGYGAGKVEIWDRGTFTVLEQAEGKLVVDLQGKKARGAHHMVRTDMNDDPRNWLIFLGKPPVGPAVARQTSAAVPEKDLSTRSPRGASGNHMDTPKEQRVKGAIDRTVGKIKEEVGDATGNRSLEAKGQLQGAKGKIEGHVGKFRDDSD